MAKLKILKDPVTDESFYPYTHEKAITDDNGNEVIAAIKSDIAANTSNITKNANDIKTLQEDLSSVGQQADANKEEIAELNNKKITKFYASNLGETTLNDSDNGKIQDMMLYGKSEQFTTTGKNLANGQNIHCYINSSKNICGVTNNDTGMVIDVSKLTNVTISTRSIQDRYRAGCVDTVPTKGANVTCYNGIIKDRTKDSYTIDTTDYNYLIVNATKLEDIQVEKGSEATSYEPYTGGIPSPSPDYPQEIKSVVNPKVKVCGKNLFNHESLVEGGSCTFSDDEIKVIDVNKLANITVPLSIKAGNNINLSFYVKGVKEQSFIVGLKYTNGNKQSVTISINANEFVYKNKTINLSEDLEGIFFGGSGGLGNGTIIKKLQIEIGSQSTEYEPYKEQAVTLPYTLNAIPVKNGGNVTIDGQQYIADYVDVERKKLILHSKEINLTSGMKWEIRITATNKNYNYQIRLQANGLEKTINTASAIKRTMYCSHFPYTNTIWDDPDLIDNKAYANDDEITVSFVSTSSMDSLDKFKQFLDENEVKVIYLLEKPIEIDLTDEEVKSFKELATYYPTTNVMVTSDQLAGFTTFNYPLSIANGWNLIKEQLGDTREYIYDMELQSAEAYVNSEYAVTLTELGV